ncbi:Fe-S cluster assembly protein SufB [Candidatus Gottesmanbacteria bacterium]|nr:Fe-S cluster assembly protein SufB [Candidatus Gottesmanbacteria bacterium]
MSQLSVAPITDYKYGFHKPEKYIFKAKKGLSKKIVEEISWYKNEPDWMRQFRLSSLDTFAFLSLPTWGADLRRIDFADLYYYIRPVDRKVHSWKELPNEIRDTYDKIGIPQAEKKFLGGVNAQYESEIVYESIQKSLSTKGVIFLDMESAVKQYPDLVRQYFGTVVPADDNKFAALNSAVWSGGSFIYIPAGVQVKMPLQAYFRINAASVGQFERTLIIAEEGSFLHYIEGCTAPIYSTDSLHAAVVEIIVKNGARVRYTTIQNWSTNVYNLVTKRMKIEEEGIGEWVDGNIGSKVTMKYPSMFLAGKGAKGEILSLAYAGPNQHQDTGGKAIHLAPDTTSKITSKSVSKGGGATSFRGYIQIFPEARNSKVKVACNALIADSLSHSNTYPVMKIGNSKAQVEHEAVVSKIEEEQLFYLMSRGLKKEDSEAMIVNGFIEPIVKELPLEYAVELNRLMQLELGGKIG